MAPEHEFGGHEAFFRPQKEIAVQDTQLHERPEDAGRQPDAAGQVARRSRLGPDSPAWILGVSVLFLLAQLLPSLLRLPLGADEITYIARTSAHHSAVYLPPVHGHGAGLLAAPVTLLTTSLLALRIWMAFLSALGLGLSLFCWRGLRPAWVLALGGFIFASLAITELSGVQVYPDLWGAFGALAITGLLLQSVNGRWQPRVVLPLIGFISFFVVLLRPQNIAFVLAPTFLAALLIRRWRQPGVLVAMIVGMALGTVEWIAEAYLWFGGLFSRITLAGQEPPKFGLTFSLIMQAKTLSGPWYCPSNASCPTWNYPLLTLWWLGLLALVAAGLYAAWHTTAKASAALAVVTGAWCAACYILFVPFGAPRYLLPTWALFAIVAADGIVWLATKSDLKRAGVALAAAFLLIGVVTQHVVLVRETASSAAIRPFIWKANYVRDHGVKPPCVIFSPSVAYYVGCSAPWSGGSIKEILKRMPGGAQAYHEIHLPGPVPHVWVRR
jgi:hypothetical protein